LAAREIVQATDGKTFIAYFGITEIESKLESLIRNQLWRKTSKRLKKLVCSKRLVKERLTSCGYWPKMSLIGKLKWDFWHLVCPSFHIRALEITGITRLDYLIDQRGTFG
jgi:hypothetical protein